MRNVIWDRLDSLVEESKSEVFLNHKTASAKVMLLGLSDGRTSLYVSKINSDNKGSGDGSELLDMIGNYSDFNGIPVSLYPVCPDFTEQERLERWYVRKGFEFNPHLDTDPEFTFPLMVYNA